MADRILPGSADSDNGDDLGETSAWHGVTRATYGVRPISHGK
jgi:hypothetical protein